MQLLKEAIAIFKENLKLFIGIVAVPFVLSFVVALFDPGDSNSFDPIYTVLALISAIANIFMMIALTLAISNPALSVGDSYSAAKSFFWRYIGFSILSGLILIVGFVLFIIPGIILSVWFTFAAFVLLLENGGIVESLKKSREYVRGRWWAVFWRNIALTLFTVAIFAILTIITAMLPVDRGVSEGIASALSSLWLPIAVAYLYLMYQDVKTPVVATI